jgi:MAP/microtubule affinity-regulating kinase
MAPEIVNKKEHLGGPTDIWAAGVLLYALLCGMFPFKGANDKELYAKITNAELIWPEASISKEAKHFVAQMITVQNRLTAVELLRLSWLVSNRSEFLSTKESSFALK